LGEVWEGNIDFIAVIPPGSLVWRTTPDDLEKAEVLQNRFRTRLMAVVPDLRVYDPEVGFFYTADDLVDMLKITHTTLTRRVKAGRLLAIDIPGAAPLYPQVQFHRDGHLLAGLSNILAVLQPVLTGWEIAAWLARPTTTGQSPATLLDLAQLDTAVQAARRSSQDRRHGRRAYRRGGRRCVTCKARGYGGVLRVQLLQNMQQLPASTVCTRDPFPSRRR
jgi:hypothetical protein